MRKLKYYFYTLSFILIFAGCEKEEELLEGVWQRVIIEDINSNNTEEWHFIDGELIIKKINMSDPSDVDTMDTGIYVLKPVFENTYLAVDELKQEGYIGYNADWDVLTLNSEQMVISHDVYGGITKREFIKIE